MKNNLQNYKILPPSDDGYQMNEEERYLDYGFEHRVIVIKGVGIWQSVNQRVNPSLNQSVHPSVHLFIYPMTIIHARRAAWPAENVCRHQSVSQSICQSLFHSGNPPTHPSIYPSTHPPIHPSIRPPIHPSTIIWPVSTLVIGLKTWPKTSVLTPDWYR